MQTPTVKQRLLQVRSILAAVALVLLIGGSAAVHADQFDEQINALNQQNSQARGILSDLTAQAGSYQDAINALQAQIDGLQASLNTNLAKQAELQQQIDDAKAKIEQERTYLGDDLKAMYVDGQLSTIEELATSKSLSDYVDKEEYRTAVQNKIDAKIKEINALQAQLKKQKDEMDVLISTQQQQSQQLNATQIQQQQMLAYNEGQQAAFNQQISANSGKIADLRRQQIAANARFAGGAPGSGPACGGGYPARWCEIAQDSVIDSWGMYNRECVSYTAFKVAASGRSMPYWGGVGNANQWDDNARAAGIPTDTNPRPGDVAISNSGFYGHAMYVESVNGDGTINISQYNANLDGRYSERYNLNPVGLVFIHF
jgi:surface antigen/peptidoglycan hydrolase CwlO-like protein